MFQETFLCPFAGRIETCKTRPVGQQKDRNPEPKSATPPHNYQSRSLGSYLCQRAHRPCHGPSRVFCVGSCLHFRCKRTQNHSLPGSFLAVLYSSGNSVDLLILHWVPSKHLALIFADKTLDKDRQI